jgi:NitT/TauT family transport system ATP-binding protein
VSALDVDIRRKVFNVPGGATIVALENLRFSIPRGQFACLVGPSGSGKTTLLHIISGIDTMVEGRIDIVGHPSHEATPIGYMFQAPRLMPWLSVLENVRLVASDSARGSNKPQLLMERMGLGEFLDMFPNRLSGGMQRRVALARALINDPPLLLLDEPFASLDEPVVARLRALLLDMCVQRETTVLFVTHNLREAVQLGDRILFMSARPGSVVMDYPVPRTGSRGGPTEETDEICCRLLSEHPAILSGLQSDADDDGAGPDGASATVWERNR